METVELKIEGMTCGGCVGSVQRVLQQVPGVEEVQVTLQPGAASVRYDPARTDVSALAAAVEDAGYDVAR